MTLTNLQGGALLDLYTFVPLYRYTIYTLYYTATLMFFPYVFLCIVRIFLGSGHAGRSGFGSRTLSFSTYGLLILFGIVFKFPISL